MNEHAECLRGQATEIELLDTVEAAIMGTTMRNAADEIDKLNREKTILMKVSGVTQEELDEAIASLVCVRRREDDKAL